MFLQVPGKGLDEQERTPEIVLWPKLTCINSDGGHVHYEVPYQGVVPSRDLAAIDFIERWR